MTFLVQIIGLIPPLQLQAMFLVLNFPNFVIVVAKKMDFLKKIKKNCKQQKKTTKILKLQISKKFKKLMSKSLKVILIIPTLNI